MVAAKIAVDCFDTGQHIAGIINEAERRVRAALPIAHVIYLDPDTHSAACSATPPETAPLSAELPQDAEEKPRQNGG